MLKSMKVSVPTDNMAEWLEAHMLEQACLYLKFDSATSVHITMAS